MASNVSVSSTTTVSSSSSSTAAAPVESMRNYGASWFENLSTLAVEYQAQKLAKSQPVTPQPLPSPTADATPAMHGYGGSFFGTVDARLEQAEAEADKKLAQAQAQQTADSKTMHNYGDSWFEHMWEDWQQLKMRKSA